MRARYDSDKSSSQDKTIILRIVLGEDANIGIPSPALTRCVEYGGVAAPPLIGGFAANIRCQAGAALVGRWWVQSVVVYLGLLAPVDKDRLETGRSLPRAGDFMLFL